MTCKAVRRSLCGVALRERPLLHGVPSFPTVHWTVGKFTLCGAPKGCIDLRSIWDSVPYPARGAASGLCQRDIVPLETRCYRLRRFGTLSQTLPEAPPLDSAKGTLSLWKPGVIGFADLGLCPIPCQRDIVPLEIRCLSACQSFFNNYPPRSQEVMK